MVIIAVIILGLVAFGVVQKIKSDQQKKDAQERKREAWRKYSAKRRALRKTAKKAK